MKHISWTEIENFHNLRRSLRSRWSVLPVVSYLAKVKLHGTNAGIRVESDGTVTAQSRSRDVSVDSDNMGFANWLSAHADLWKELPGVYGDDTVVVFGEWAGKGIMKGVACSQVDKFFAVFCIESFKAGRREIISSPTAISAFLNRAGVSHPDVRVIPWVNDSAIQIDLENPTQANLDLINALVARVETCDPLIESWFGVKGVGEGVVYYPIHVASSTEVDDTDLMFKAKGEAHSTVAKAKPAQVDAPAAETLEGFVNLVCTPARLEQGVRSVADGQLSFDQKKIGAFIGWISQDVNKECQAELEASGLTWKQVASHVATFVRGWYLQKLKEI